MVKFQQFLAAQLLTPVVEEEDLILDLVDLVDLVGAARELDPQELLLVAEFMLLVEVEVGVEIH